MKINTERSIVTEAMVRPFRNMLTLKHLVEIFENHLIAIPLAMNLDLCSDKRVQ